MSEILNSNVNLVDSERMAQELEVKKMVEEELRLADYTGPPERDPYA